MHRPPYERSLRAARRRGRVTPPARTARHPRAAAGRGWGMAAAASSTSLLPPACAGCGLPGPAACDGVPRRPRGPAAAAAAGAAAAPVPVPGGALPGVPRPLAGGRQAVAYAGRRAGAGRRPQGRPPPGPRRGAGRRIAAAVPAPAARARCWCRCRSGPRRLAERGFNQSLLIARELGRALGAAGAPTALRAGARGAGPARVGGDAPGRARRRAPSRPAGAPPVPAPRRAGRRRPHHRRHAGRLRPGAARAAAPRTVGAACFARALRAR